MRYQVGDPHTSLWLQQAEYFLKGVVPISIASQVV